MDEADARARVTGARVARLATVNDDGGADLVPVTFALDGDTFLTAVDHKPKRTRALRRLENVRRRPEVTVLVDHYDEDWSALWWVRLRGTARVVEAAAVDLSPLRAKYDQYRDHPPEGPVIAVAVSDWRWWSPDP